MQCYPAPVASPRSHPSDRTGTTRSPDHDERSRPATDRARAAAAACLGRSGEAAPRLRRRAADLWRGRGPLAPACQGSDRSGGGQGQSCRVAVSQFAGFCRVHARRRADRGSGAAAQHAVDGGRAWLAAEKLGHRLCPRGAAIPLAGLRCDSAAGCPGARSGRRAAAGFAGNSLAAACLVFRRAGPGRTSGLVAGRAGNAGRAYRRYPARCRRGPCLPGGPLRHHPHVRIDRQTQRRDPRSWHADPPPRQHQPGAQSGAGGHPVRDIAVVLGRRICLRAGRHSGGGRADCLFQRDRTRQSAGFHRARAPDDEQRLCPCDGPLRPGPELCRRAISRFCARATSIRSCRPAFARATWTCATISTA